MCFSQHFHKCTGKELAGVYFWESRDDAVVPLGTLLDTDGCLFNQMEHRQPKALRHRAGYHLLTNGSSDTIALDCYV